MNVWDVVLAVCIALAVARALWSMRKTRRAGGCASCPFAEGCGHHGAGSCEAHHG